MVSIYEPPPETMSIPAEVANAPEAQASGMTQQAKLASPVPAAPAQPSLLNRFAQQAPFYQQRQALPPAGPPRPQYQPQFQTPASNFGGFGYGGGMGYGGGAPPWMQQSWAPPPWQMQSGFGGGFSGWGGGGGGWGGAPQWGGGQQWGGPPPWQQQPWQQQMYRPYQPQQPVYNPNTAQGVDPRTGATPSFAGSNPQPTRAQYNPNTAQAPDAATGATPSFLGAGQGAAPAPQARVAPTFAPQYQRQAISPTPAGGVNTQAAQAPNQAAMQQNRAAAIKPAYGGTPIYNQQTSLA